MNGTALWLEAVMRVITAWHNSAKMMKLLTRPYLTNHIGGGTSLGSEARAKIWLAENKPQA